MNPIAKKVKPSSSDTALSSSGLKRQNYVCSAAELTSLVARVNKRTKANNDDVSESSFELIRRKPIASSSPSLSQQSPLTNEKVQPNEKKSSSVQTICSSYHNEQFADTMKPSTHMMTALHARSYYVRSRPSLSMPKGFFVPISEERIESYGQDIINAVRSQDIATLRQMHREERSLSCCNKFGESILHMSCRRGFTDVVRFLLDEVKLSLKVVDDYGRTPLHDSMWTCEPNIELIQMLIQRSPELLFLSDKRGHLPLDYVQKEYYAKWITFIDEHIISDFITKIRPSLSEDIFVMPLCSRSAVKNVMKVNDVYLKQQKQISQGMDAAEHTPFLSQ